MRAYFDCEEILAKINELIDVQKMTTKAAGEVLGLTKNQVIGLRYRDRQRRALEGATTPEVTAPMTKPPPSKRKQINVSRPGNLTPKIVMQREEALAGAFDVPSGKVGVYNLEHRHCKFICDDGYFCGKDHARGSIYCAEHHARCYVKSTPNFKRTQSCHNSAPKPWRLSVGLTDR